MSLNNTGNTGNMDKLDDGVNGIHPDSGSLQTSLAILTKKTTPTLGTLCRYREARWRHLAPPAMIQMRIGPVPKLPTRIGNEYFVMGSANI